MFNEERKREIDEMRKGLSLASLFAKPRPVWADPVFVATFGDAFIERTAMEGNSSFPRSFTVLSFVLQKSLQRQEKLLSAAGGFDRKVMTQVSDCAHVMKQSEVIFKALLKVTSESQLLGFLKKLKKYIQAINVGESLLLPACVEGVDMAILLERHNERSFKVVVIQTDPDELDHHAASAAVSMPEINYRTCMVLNDVSKKNVLDDVFWLALYNLKVHSHKGDLHKFYEVLLPFLTGKPLGTTLLEAERAALRLDSTSSLLSLVPEASESSPPASLSDSLGGGGDGSKGDSGGGEGGATAGPTATMSKSRFAIPATFGPWRTPQRSDTSYVRLFFEALHFMLTRRGVSDLQANQVCPCLHCLFYKSLM